MLFLIVLIGFSDDEETDSLRDTSSEKSCVTT